MNTTTKTLITLAAMAASLTALSAPVMASAQPMHQQPMHEQPMHERPMHQQRWENDNRGSAAVAVRINTLRDRIINARRNGDLSRREATRVDARLDNIIALKRSFERSDRGLSGSEVANLNDRLDRLSYSLRDQAHDGNRR